MNGASWIGRIVLAAVACAGASACQLEPVDPADDDSGGADGSSELTGGRASGGHPNGGSGGEADDDEPGGSPSKGGSASTPTAGDTGTSGAAGDDEEPTPTGPDLPEPGSDTTKPFQGPLTIESAADAQVFCETYDGVDGSLTVKGAELETLGALSCLVEVTGALELTSTSLESVNLPNLAAVGSLVASNQAALHELVLPKLATVHEELRVTGAALVSFALPALTQVGGKVVITGMSTLDSLALPKLGETGGDLELDNPNMTALDLSALAEVGGSLVLTGAALEQLTLKSLQTVHGDLALPGCSYDGVDFSALTAVGGKLQLTGDQTSAAATELSLPLLATVKSVVIAGFTGLHSIALPQVTKLDSLELDCGGDALDVSLPKLTEAGEIHATLEGTGKLALPLLTQVTNELELDGALALELPELTQVGDCQCGEAAPSAPGALIDLALPKLETAKSLLLGPGVRAVSLPNLDQLETLTLTDTAVTALELPALVSGNVSAKANSLLTSVDLPSLQNCGELAFDDNPALTQIDASALVSATGTIALSALPQLAEVDLGQLTSAGTLSCVDTPELQAVALSKLETLSTLKLVHTGLLEVELESLTALATALDVESNPALATLALPVAQITSADILVIDNPSLETLELPELESARKVVIEGNSALISLAGLGALESASELWCVDNTLLLSLSGLSNLDEVTGDIGIYGNPLLTPIAVSAFVSGIASHEGDVILSRP